VAARTEGARPNAPRDDVYRMQDAIRSCAPDAIVAIGGGSTIDAAKAAVVLAALGGNRHDIEPFFGVGKVSEVLAARAGRLPPLLAVQTASGSGAHLTKYSNITDPAGAQKKLVIDDAIVPARAVFDYAVTRTAPADLTADGAFDGLCHILEAYYGAPPGEIERLEAIARAAVELIVSAVRQAVEDPGDLAAREALGLGTDLGGLAIMVGSTSGPHLNSFSLVDVLSHGRAVAVLEPYYTVFFAPAIGRQLRMLAEILSRAGLIGSPPTHAKGRDLGLAVAEGMLALARSLHFPTRLGEIPGFSDAHVARALSGAKNPQLASKLQAMPVALAAGEVDEYMGAILRAARDGDLSAVPRAPRRARGLGT
jgi:alcohol dehydrogenase